MICSYCGDELIGSDLKECFDCMVIWGKHHTFVPPPTYSLIGDWIEISEGVLLIKFEVEL